MCGEEQTKNRKLGKRPLQETSSEVKTAGKRKKGKREKGNEGSPMPGGRIGTNEGKEGKEGKEGNQKPGGRVGKNEYTTRKIWVVGQVGTLVAKAKYYFSHLKNLGCGSKNIWVYTVKNISLKIGVVGHLNISVIQLKHILLYVHDQPKPKPTLTAN